MLSRIDKVYAKLHIASIIVGLKFSVFLIYTMFSLLNFF